jgi:hypothetical protein
MQAVLSSGLAAEALVLGTEGLELMVVRGASTQTAAAVFAVLAKGRQALMELTATMDVVTAEAEAQEMRVLLAVTGAMVESQVVVLEVVVVAQAKMVRTAGQAVEEK